MNSLDRCQALPEKSDLIGGETHVMEEEKTHTASMTPPAEGEAEETETNDVSHDHFPAWEGDVRYEMARYIKSIPNIVRRSYVVPGRLCTTLTQSTFIRDLQRSYVVVVLFNPVKKKMAVMGEMENVLACLSYVRTLVDQWQERLKQCEAKARE